MIWTGRPICPALARRQPNEGCGLPGRHVKSAGYDAFLRDEHRPEVIDIGQGWTRDKAVAERFKEAVPIVAGESVYEA